jgi:FkbM family methyltransferase
VDYKDVFVNFDTYETLLEESKKRERYDKISILETVNGTKIAARHNIYDVKIIKEQFLDLQYFPDFFEDNFAPKVVLDIGGYIGDLSLYCAETFGSKVHCYEPTPQNYRIIKRNLELNPHLNDIITVHNKGVSSSNKFLELNVQEILSEIHASTHKKYKRDVTTIQVPCVSLEDAIKELNEPKIDLLKIDCEGEEFNILGNCNTEILANNVKYLAFEYHNFVEDYKDKLENLLNDLEKNFIVLKKSKKLCFLKSKK